MKPIFGIFLLFGLTFLAQTSAKCILRECGPNESFQCNWECRTHTEPSCEYPEGLQIPPEPCFKGGCFCSPGFVREHERGPDNDAAAACIKPEQCHIWWKPGKKSDVWCDEKMMRLIIYNIRCCDKILYFLFWNLCKQEIKMLKSI